jgi:sulfur-oxidizing protein SoxX
MKPALLATAVASFLAIPAFAEEVPYTAIEWVDGLAIETPLTSAEPDLENGKALMNKGSGNCIACHSVTELSHLQWHGEIGPVLDGVADRYTEAELRGMLVDSKRWFPDTMMPAFYRTEGFIRVGDAYTGKPLEGEVMPLLTAQQIEDVIAYLLTLKESS